MTAPDDLAPLRAWMTEHRAELRELTLSWPNVHTELVVDTDFAQDPTAVELVTAGMVAYDVCEAVFDLACVAWRHPEDQERALGLLTLALLDAAQLPPFGLAVSQRKGLPDHARATGLATSLIKGARAALVTSAAIAGAGLSAAVGEG